MNSSFYRDGIPKPLDCRFSEDHTIHPKRPIVPLLQRLETCLYQFLSKQRLSDAMPAPVFRYPFWRP